MRGVAVAKPSDQSFSLRGFRFRGCGILWRGGGLENAAGSRISERETWQWVNKLKGQKKCAMPRREWFGERLFLSSFVLFVFQFFRTSIGLMKMRLTENNEKLTKRSIKSMRILFSSALVPPAVVLLAEGVGEGVDWKGEKEKARKKCVFILLRESGLQTIGKFFEKSG